jgi:tetratricopeptide (TPR) repeat protein
VEELLKEGHPAEVIELAERALKAVEKAMGSVDDSDGYMGGILERLQDLHHKACKKTKPDPEALAQRLFQWELRTDYDTFHGAAETYADVLGKKGLTVYRTLAEAEWVKVPALGPGRDDPEKYGKRFRITHIRETLARQTGDVEAVVAVMKRDLSLAYHYLQIAETYKRARQHDLALEWAERGVKAFPERTDSRLREFLAGEYHRHKRHDEAMALIWTEFTESPNLEHYRNLKAHAERLGQWEPWREKALDYFAVRSPEQKTSVKEIGGPGITVRTIRNSFGYFSGKKT